MLSNKQLVAKCAIAFCCNVALIVLIIKYSTGGKCYITISEHQEVAAVLPDNFLSIGIDTSEIEKFNGIDFSKTRLVQLAHELAPARVRLGGTLSERLIFSKYEKLPHVSCKHCPHHSHTTPICHLVKNYCRHKFLPFFLMTGKKWGEINRFCKAANLKLLFSINILLRDQGEWIDMNAIDIIRYSKEHKYDIDWQLGNEPNSFHHVFNITVTPEMLAKDFKKLRMLLDENGYKHALLVGPDTTRPLHERPENLRYMIQFLGNASHYISVRSWHQYYLNSRTAKLDDFWNPGTLDLLKDQIKMMKNHTLKYSHIPMWLTETSSSYGGGAPGLSNSYAAAPLWIDKLGLSAKNNITTVVRQSFYGGNYSLVDADLNPLPDWWISVLYKKLVGNKVLHVKCKCSRYQRMYMHCANKNYTNDTTAVTVYAVNLEMKKVNFVLNGTGIHGDNQLIDEFVIRAASNNRKAKTVLLNGWPLYYESSLPKLQPVKIRYGNSISMPPYSVAFWVIKNTSIKICK